MRQPAQVAIVSDGRVALVRLPDGALGLPELPGWDGNAWTYIEAVSALGDAVPAPCRSAVTHLAPLHYGQGGTAPVALAEARRQDVASDGWWRPGDAAPLGMPERALPGLAAALTGRFEGPQWPPFCMPGTTSLIRSTIAGDAVMSELATLSSTDGSAEPHELSQVQGWPISSVWRNDHLVLKITSPGWQGEATVTRLLADVAPQAVPRVLSSGILPGNHAPPIPYFAQQRVTEPPEAKDGLARAARSTAALIALAQLQRSCSGREEELLAAGAADRTPRNTAGELTKLWEAVKGELSSDEREKLGTMDVLAREVLRRLERTPAVIVHGDLHLGNVLADESGSPLLIDWTDAALAWPGVDAYLLRHHEVDGDEARDALVTSYVDALGPEHEQGVRLGLDVAPLYHALSYLRIRRFMPTELAGPFGGAVAQFVRRQLEVFGL